jgi:hypothetical protein
MQSAVFRVSAFINAFLAVIAAPLLAAPTAPAQQGLQTSHPTGLTYADRIALAHPLLLRAESTASGLTPDSRALLLYRLGGAWYPLDRSHAVQLYRQAFDAAVASDSKFRGLLERAIIVDLIPMSPPDALDEIARADPPDPWPNPDSQETKRNVFYGMLIRYTVAQGDIAFATHAYDSALKLGILNEGATARLMEKLPATASAERVRIFSAAVDYYQAHPESQGPIWTFGLSDLIARNYAKLPRRLVLQAIEMELNSASTKAGDASIGGGPEHVFFHTPYDLQLFVVAPALRALDPKRAEELLAQHSEVAGYLKRLPQGMLSIDESYRTQGLDPDFLRENQDRVPVRFSLFDGEGPAPKLDAVDMGLEFTLPATNSRPDVVGEGEFYPNNETPESKILDRTGPCPADIPAIVKESEDVPVLRKQATFCSAGCAFEDTFPRAKLLQAVAERCTYGGDAVRARQVLEAQVELLSQVLPRDRVKFLADAADLYLRLGDHEQAAQVVRLGLKAAREVFDENQETYRDKVAEGLWPAAESYRLMLALGVMTDLSATEAAIDAIPDATMAEYERVMLARALLGVPVRMSMVGGVGGGYGWTEPASAIGRF